MSAAATIVPLAAVEPSPLHRDVAVGVFDGVHVGHRAVIGAAGAVLTFEPHPAAVLAPDRAPALLTTLRRKAELVGSLGVRELVVIAFDSGVAAQTADAFVDEVLVGRLGAGRVRIGENFRFGHRAAGDAAQLLADGRFATEAVSLTATAGSPISSTRIRTALAAGDVAGAALLLGEPWVLDGEVLHGEKRGRELGYPTANLAPPPGLAMPPHGVYACRATLPDGRTAPAAVSIGVRPQFAAETELGELVEAYLLDVDEDLYGQGLRLAFLERLRGEERFDGVPALLEQMGRDVDRTREVVLAAGVRA